jgi:hypothetical protein
MFHLRECMSFTPIFNKDTTNSNEQPARKLYCQSSTMPPKLGARGELGLASTCLSTEHLRSPVRRGAAILTVRGSLLQEDEIYD